MRLAQVFSNLLNNAAKFTPAGGDIRVTAERQGNQAVVRVKDSGIGIAPELMPKVFDMFVHGETVTERSHGGLGLGLERLTMKLLDEQNVRETTMFPRDVSRLEP
jgi:signal transduction histidine kinase